VGGASSLNGNSVDGENMLWIGIGHIVTDQARKPTLCWGGGRGELELTPALRPGGAGLAKTLDSDRGASSCERRLAEARELTPLLLAEEAEAGDVLALEMISKRPLSGGWRGHDRACGRPRPGGARGAMTFGGHGSEVGRRFWAGARRIQQRRGLPCRCSRHVDRFRQTGAAMRVTSGPAGTGALRFVRQNCGQRRGPFPPPC